jgi:CRISPR-associated protein Cmr5
MKAPKTEPRSILRDQRRALDAYGVVARVPEAQRKHYQIAVNDFGANILRSGLCAAIASVQRLGSRGELLLDHIAAAGLPGLERAAANDVARRVRELDADAYMIATREALKVAVWLKRAVQATFGEA